MYGRKLQAKDLAHGGEAIAGDGDAAIDGRVKAQVFITFAAGSHGADTVEVDDKLTVTAHKRRAGQLFLKHRQALHRMIALFAPGSDKRITLFGLEVEDTIYLDQLDQTISALYRQSA